MFECVVRTLCSASDVSLAVALLDIMLTIVNVTLRIRGKATASFQVNAVGCQQREVNEQRVYTLPLVPGVYYSWGFEQFTPDSSLAESQANSSAPNGNGP